MAKTLSIKTGKGLEIGEQKEVKAKIGNGIDFGNDNEVVAKGNTQKAIQVSEDGIELKVDNTTAKINEDGELEVVATKPDISAGGGINLITPTGETTTEISVKTDNTTTRINADGEIEAIGTKPDIESGNGIELNTPVGSTTTTISAKSGNGIEVDSTGIKAKASDGIEVDSNGIKAKVDNTTTRINADGEIEAIGTKPDIESGNGIELNTPVGSTTTTISAKSGNGIEVDSTGIKAKASNGIEVDSNGIKVKAKTNSGIVVDSNGIGTDINTNTLEFDENGKINVKDKAPNVESGNGIDIATSGNTKTISAKGGNGIGVGSSGISVNVGGGIHITSNKVGINANFTEVDTPLGTNASNINLHSDGKISFASGGGGGAVKIAEIDKNTLKTLLTKSVNITNVNNNHIEFSLIKSNFNFTIPITTENRDKYMFLIFSEFIFNPQTTINKTGIISIRTQMKTVAGENGKNINYIIPENNTSIFINNRCFGNYIIVDRLPVVDNARILDIIIDIDKIQSSATITPTTIEMDLTSNAYAGAMYIYAIPKQ